LLENKLKKIQKNEEKIYFEKSAKQIQGISTKEYNFKKEFQTKKYSTELPIVPFVKCYDCS